MEEAGEFQDWEMLQNTETGSVHLSELCREFGGIEGDSEGAIRSDYFSLDSQKRYARTVSVEEESSVDSDNPSWVDPGSEPRYGDNHINEVGFEGIAFARKNSPEFWSDSSSDGSVSRKFSDFEVKHELGCGDDSKRGVGFEGIGEIQGIEVKSKDSGEFWSDSGGDGSVSRKIREFGGEHELGYGGDWKGEVACEGIGIIERIEVENKDDSGKFLSDSSGDESVLVKFGGIEGEGQSGVGEFDKMGNGSEFSSEGGMVADQSETGGVVEVEGGADEELKTGEGEKRGMVWWKLPLEILKFCVFRVSPVWSLSIAATAMGFVILWRRLYKMKQKSRSIPLKVTVDDKKISQFMTRAARLNDAFSVVRRVPIIRPSLPVGGVTPWPAMSLR